MLTRARLCPPELYLQDDPWLPAVHGTPDAAEQLNHIGVRRPPTLPACQTAIVTLVRRTHALVAKRKISYRPCGGVREPDSVPNRDANTAACVRRSIPSLASKRDT